MKKKWGALLKENTTVKTKLNLKTPAAEGDAMSEDGTEGETNHEDDENTVAKLPWETEQVQVPEELILVVKKLQ